MLMVIFSGLILLCLLGIRLGFSYHYISLVHQLILYFEKKKSALIFVTADLLIIIAGIVIGGIAYTIDSLMPFLPPPHPNWRIRHLEIICSLVIAGIIELYRFYIKRASGHVCRRGKNIYFIRRFQPVLRAGFFYQRVIFRNHAEDHIF